MFVSYATTTRKCGAKDLCCATFIYFLVPFQSAHKEGKIVAQILFCLPHADGNAMN